MESAAGFDLLVTSSGGREGGHTALSAEAEQLIGALHRVSDPTTTLAHERFQAERDQLPEV
jgi:molybdenum-dependent DNA-binding transcriptional regulator ModE